MKKLTILIIGTLLHYIAAAQYIIPVSTSAEIINLNGVASKDIKRLFDNNTSTQISSDQVTDFRTSSYPYSSYVVLDSIYSLSQVEYYIANSNNTTMSLAFYDSARNQVGDTVILSISGYQQWKTVAASRTGVRFIQVRGFGNITFVSDGLREIRVRGTATAKANSIYPTGVSITAVTDLGVYAHGINTIGDRLNRKDAGGDTIMKRVTKAARFYWTGQDFDIYPETYNNRLVNAPINLGRYGTNHSGNLLDQFKRWDIKPMMTKGGGSIKWLNTTDANQNTTYLGGTIAQSNRYTETTANPEIDTAWTGLAEQYHKLIGLYGSNVEADVPSNTILNGTTTLGQNTMDIFEWDNEANRWWQQSYYHTPKAWYEAIRKVYTRGKEADVYSKIYAAALPGIDTTFWKAVYFYHFLQNGSGASFPADGFNFNHYINNLKSEQGGGGDTYGISPERWQTIQEITALKSFFNRVFPNKRVQWTEYGYATDDASPYDVNVIGSKTERQVQADWTLRLKALVQTQKFVERMYYYAYFEDFTSSFNTMAMIQDNYDGNSVYTNSTVYPVGYAQAQEIYVEKDYKFFADVITNGDSTSVWVTRKDHNTDATKKIYKVWYGTSAGVSANNYTLSVPGATSAKRYSLRYNSYLPDSATLTITDGTVSIPISEAMTWVVVTQSGGGPSNIAPTVDAGANRFITLPTSSLSITATAADSDGTIQSYAWSKISGTGGTITNGNTATATFSSLSQGNYVFRVTVTDDDGATVYDDVTVTVNSNSGYTSNCNIVNLETAPRVYRTFYTDPVTKTQYRLTMYQCGLWVRQRFIGGRWEVIPY